MSDHEELKETAVSDPAQIDALKEQEKEKLSAAEEAYKRRQNANTGSVTPASEAARPQRSRHEPRNAWVPGLILIGLGIIFLLNNTTGFAIHNWWALFIMIPAIGSFSKAADAIRTDGFDRQAWSALALGAVLTLIASAFLFNLDWGLIWPAFLIIGGLGMFFGAWKSW